MSKNTLTHIYVQLDFFKYQDNSMGKNIQQLMMKLWDIFMIKKEPWPNPHIINSTQYWP